MTRRVLRRIPLALACASIFVTSLALAGQAQGGGDSRITRSPGPPPTGTRAQLDSLVLKSSVFGSGVRTVDVSAGRQVASQVTLDLCNQHFASESLRRTRLQIGFTHRHPDFSTSNELVGYRHGGVRQAMRELRHVVTHCPRGPLQAVVAGQPPQAFRLKPLALSGLLPGSIALEVQASSRVRGRSHTQMYYAIYQARGAVLSAVYAFASSSELAERLAETGARQSARNLLAG